MVRYWRLGQTLNVSIAAPEFHFRLDASCWQDEDGSIGSSFLEIEVEGGLSSVPAELRNRNARVSGIGPEIWVIRACLSPHICHLVSDGHIVAVHLSIRRTVTPITPIIQSVQVAGAFGTVEIILDSRGEVAVHTEPSISWGGAQPTDRINAEHLADGIKVIVFLSVGTPRAHLIPRHGELLRGTTIATSRRHRCLGRDRGGLGNVGFRRHRDGHVSTLVEYHAPVVLRGVVGEVAQSEHAVVHRDVGDCHWQREVRLGDLVHGVVVADGAELDDEVFLRRVGHAREVHDELAGVLDVVVVQVLLEEHAEVLAAGEGGGGRGGRDAAAGPDLEVAGVLARVGDLDGSALRGGPHADVGVGVGHEGHEDQHDEQGDGQHGECGSNYCNKEMCEQPAQPAPPSLRTHTRTLSTHKPVPHTLRAHCATHTNFNVLLRPTPN
jgi:hypothetical protein